MENSYLANDLTKIYFGPLDLTLIPLQLCDGQKGGPSMSFKYLWKTADVSCSSIMYILCLSILFLLVSQIPLGTTNALMFEKKSVVMYCKQFSHSHI